MFQIKQNKSHPNNMQGRKETSFQQRIYAGSKGKTSKTRFPSILTLLGVGRLDQGQPPVFSRFHIKINIISNSKEFCFESSSYCTKRPFQHGCEPFQFGRWCLLLLPQPCRCSGYTHMPLLLFLNSEQQ